MGFTTFKGQREALTGNAEIFKEKIKGYMLKRGYILIKDSFVDGCLADLIFKKPIMEGNKETWVEAKFKDQSIKEKEFLKEFSRYFISYMKKSPDDKFKLFLFIKKCLSQMCWRKIFDDTKGAEKDLKEFYEDIEKNLDGESLELFLSFSFDDFISFIYEVEILEGDCDTLQMNIEKLGEKFNVNNSFLDENTQIENKPEKITSNFVKLTSFPVKLWVSELLQDANMSEFWEYALLNGTYSNMHKVYSLNDPQTNGNLNRFIVKNSSKQIVSQELDNQLLIKLLPFLTKSFLIRKGIRRGLTYNKYFDCLFYVAKEIDQKLDGRKAFKKYFKEGELNFVKHDAIKIKVFSLDNDIYASFELILIFTKDGKELLTGESAKTLHHKFTKRFSFNNTEKSKFNHWLGLFKLQDNTLGVRDSFIFSTPIELKMKVTCVGGDFFDDDLSKYTGEKDEEF